MACVSDPGAFLRECFERMAGDEPGRFDIVFLEKFEEAWGTDVSSKEAFFSPLDQLTCRIRDVTSMAVHTPTNITGAVFAAI